MMDNGFVKITKDDKWIYLTCYGKERFTIIGDDGLTIGRKLVQRTNINPEHAIYIGYELAKAEIALKLNKNYVQDKPLFKYDKGDDSINNNEGDD
ncbi:MAG: dihydropteroate synthase-like protein, partial [Sulfolobus sp.]